MKSDNGFVVAGAAVVLVAVLGFVLNMSFFYHLTYKIFFENGYGGHDSWTISALGPMEESAYAGGTSITLLSATQRYQSVLA